MHVVFVEPAFPRNQREFVRGLKEVGATVTAIGEAPADALDSELQRYLDGYEQVADGCAQGRVPIEDRPAHLIDLPKHARPEGWSGRVVPDGERIVRLSVEDQASDAPRCRQILPLLFEGDFDLLDQVIDLPCQQFEILALRLTDLPPGPPGFGAQRDQDAGDDDEEFGDESGGGTVAHGRISKSTTIG